MRKPRHNTIKNMDGMEYMRTVKDGSVDMVLTDPPYAISRKTGFSGCVNGVDHKDGRKDDINVDEHHDISDFQPMHKNVNVAKRTHCKECINTGIRFDATVLGYSCAQWIGDYVYRGTCVGCYWYSPIEFNQKVSKGYKKRK